MLDYRKNIFKKQHHKHFLRHLIKIREMFINETNIGTIYHALYDYLL